MSSAVSILGQCPECCECPDVVAEFDHVEKAGQLAAFYPEAGGYQDTPFASLVVVETATAEFSSQETGVITYVFKVVKVIESASSASFDYNNTSSLELEPCPSPSPVSASGFGSTIDPYEALLDVLPDALSQRVSCDVGGSCELYLATRTGTEATTYITDTDQEVFYVIAGGSDIDTCIGDILYSTTYRYTNPITDTDILDELSAEADPLFPGTWNAAGSDTYANTFISYDRREVIYNKVRYRLRFKIPKVGFGKCFRINWTERFEPDVGPVVDTPKNWQWAEGDVPAGYDPDDPSTWPVAGEGGLGYFEMTQPRENGETRILNITTSCRACEETSNVIPAT